MTRHHPDVNLLLEHVSGTLPLAQSACIAVHNSFCGICRKTTSQLESLGAEMVTCLDDAPISAKTRELVLESLDKDSLPSVGHAAPGNPPFVKRLIQGDFDDLEWRKVTGALSVSHFKTGDESYECALYQITAGGRIPEHDHNGPEMTVVLRGGFSDKQGVYHPGDFIYRDRHQVHSPTALESEDCLCFAVTEAPLRFTGWRYRWMNPFLRFNAG